MPSITLQVPDALFDALEADARREQRSLAAHVVLLVEGMVRAPQRHSILALRGLGEETWRDIDAVDNICAERDSWR